ncbi:MAG: Ig-like domain-containing protein [Isosphaeraceae bacterium]
MNTFRTVPGHRAVRHGRPVVEALEARNLLSFVSVTPDPTFGQCGTSIELLQGLPSSSYPNVVVGQYPLASGKILEVIRAAKPTATGGRRSDCFSLFVRLNSDGSPDASFGNGGQVPGNTDAGYPDSFDVYASALQPDGKVLLVGSSGRRPVSGPPRLTVERANPDGSLDDGFHYDGPALGFSDGISSGIAVSADGRIAVATSVPSKSPQGLDGFSPAFLRLNPDGSLDHDFGPKHDGTSVLDVYSNSLQAPFPFANNLAFSGDRIVAAETVGNPVLVSRLDASGLLDPTFGSGGFASNNALSFFSSRAMAIDPQGRILLAGDSDYDPDTFHSTPPRHMVLARFDASGLPDPGFSTGDQPGLVAVTFGSRRSTAMALSFQSGGKILVAGGVGAADGRWDLATARLDDNGTLDPSFGPGGTAITATEIFANGSTSPSTFAFDPAGKILEARCGTDDEDRPVNVVHRFRVADTTPPTVTRFGRVARQGRTLRMALTFSEPMDPAGAGRTSSYQLLYTGRDGKLGTCDDRVVRLRKAAYDVSTRTTTLTPRNPPAMSGWYRLTAYASRLTDLAGNPLAGQGNGVPGKDYEKFFRNRLAPVVRGCLVGGYGIGAAPGGGRRCPTAAPSPPNRPET